MEWMEGEELMEVEKSNTFKNLIDILSYDMVILCLIGLELISVGVGLGFKLL